MRYDMHVDTERALDIEHGLEIARELYQAPVIEQNHGPYINSIVTHWKMMMYDHGIVINWYYNMISDTFEADYYYDNSDERELIQGEALRELRSHNVHSIVGFIVGLIYQALDNKA